MKQIKHLLTVFTLFAGLLFVSCGKNEDVKQFALDFAEKVSKNQVDSVRAFYPDAAKCDSFALVFKADSIRIAETETTGTFRVTIGKADFTVKKTEGGKMTVMESHGLFTFPKVDFELAKKTGWYDNTLRDVQNAERLSDSTFVKYLSDKIAKDIQTDLQSKIIVTKSTASHDMDNLRGICSVVVSNKSSRQIEGNEYAVTAKLYDNTSMSSMYCGSKTLTGKAISANGQVTYSFSYDVGGYPADPVCTISIHPNLGRILVDYQATGKEYEDYLTAKRKGKNF